MADIKWQEPPAGNDRGRHSTKWRDIFAALRERPGVWALVDEGAKGQSTRDNIKKGRLGGAAPKEFDATSRKREDGNYDIYARYVGGES